MCSLQNKVKNYLPEKCVSPPPPHRTTNKNNKRNPLENRPDWWQLSCSGREGVESKQPPAISEKLRSGLPQGQASWRWGQGPGSRVSTLLKQVRYPRPLRQPTPPSGFNSKLKKKKKCSKLDIMEPWSKVIVVRINLTYSANTNQKPIQLGTILGYELFFFPLYNANNK